MTKRKKEQKEFELDASYDPRLKIGISKEYLSEKPISALEAHSAIASGKLSGIPTPLEYIEFIRNLRQKDPESFERIKEEGRKEILDALWQPMPSGSARLIVSPRQVNGEYLTNGVPNLDPLTGKVIEFKDKSELKRYFGNPNDFTLSFSFKRALEDFNAVTGIVDYAGNDISAYCYKTDSFSDSFGPFGAREVKRKRI